ncbi:coiled-coil domain-containing protein 150-like [Plakobranchus ocellatus]|uniref:Coiled-coil domain-containing protein 150-like n=1 Tax=Plakobranchus ocellatus TaxID=259542 RepID=A0AAV4CIN0_9GAST|nr:coiled-coil domain-containing protein 150-like [Plakobranchus ocellatus]
MSLQDVSHSNISSTDETTDALRRRLTTAEEDTRLLMQQLEELGFSPNSKERNFNIKDASSSKTEQQSVQYKTVQDNPPGDKDSGEEKGQKRLARLIQENKNPQHVQEESLNKDNQSNLSSSKTFSTKNSKHRPITPLSLRGLAMPGSLQDPEPRKLEDFMPKMHRQSDNEPRRRQRSEHYDDKKSISIGRQELEQELIRVKRIVPQLQEELDCEMSNGQKLRAEVERLRAALEEATTEKTQLELKVEDIASTKQKALRRLAEVKEEAARESSLRASLEESHATLLSRLQDMESVIETLRSECKNHSAGTGGLKLEVVRLKEELSQEALKRQRAEDSLQASITDKDKILLNATSTQAENQRVSEDLTRLQTQYTDLIRQLEQTKTLVDNLTASKKSLEEEKSSVQARFQSLSADHDSLKYLQEETKESETRLAAEKSSLEEDFCKLKGEREKLRKELFEKKKKIDSLEKELQSTRQSLAQKNQEFTSAADGLEVELSGLKSQLEVMENEKQNVLKDKESLLEEVNQTVDTLMSERSRLQTELQAVLVEAESLRATVSRLEQDKAQMLERMGALEHQQNTQRRVEDALSEMLEQKNRLAYENGKLQSKLTQVQQELEDTAQEQGDIVQLRKLSQSLQTKYTQSQQEVSEFKILVQRLEGQAKAAVEEAEQRDQHLKVAHCAREEAEREAGRLLAQLEMLQGRQDYKVSSYEKNMAEAKSVNKEIAGTLEAVMSSHTQLQNIVENLQMELGKRDSQISQLKNNRLKDHDETKREVKDLEEKLDSLSVELKKEKEKNVKKTSRDLTEVRKQCENLSSRNQELVRSNTELRQRMADVEREKEEMRSKVAGQRHKLEYLHKAKKQVEDNLNKMKAVREEIEELEQMRDEYMRKNTEQGETIGKFVQQMSGLQEELRHLAQAYTNTQQLLKLKEEALDKERRVREEMKRKFSERKRREADYNQKKPSTDEKLQEVHHESLEISKHLQEAHAWFKGKFDKLQTEITASKQTQLQLERENSEQRKSLEDERAKAQSAAERAKEMIQTSRQTISRLADYAELSDSDTKQHIAHLKTGLGPGVRPSRLSMGDL